MKEAEKGNIDEEVPDELPKEDSESDEGSGSDDEMSIDDGEDKDDDEGEEKDDEGLTEGIEVLTEAEKRDDPYVLHFDTPLTPTELEREKGWKELEEIKGVGKVWADKMAAVPPKRESFEAYKVLSLPYIDVPSPLISISEKKRAGESG